MEPFMPLTTPFYPRWAGSGLASRLRIAAALAGLALAVGSARAQNLGFVLTPGALPGIGSNALSFTATLTNSSAGSNLYLNNISFTFFNAAGNYLGPGSNTFFANVPGILLPGETYSDITFGVTISNAIPLGDYFGSVTLLGGTNIFASNTLATQTFLVTSADTVGDGIPDWWRALYFGGSGTTTNSESCATCDADGTGQDNLFKYVAALDPTNPASEFTLVISNAARQQVQPVLSFGPVAVGRTYSLQSTLDLLAGAWSPLGLSVGPQTNGNEVSLSDSSAVQAQKFYRIQISIP
jgi:hypothetical protein